MKVVKVSEIIRILKKTVGIWHTRKAATASSGIPRKGKGDGQREIVGRPVG